VVTLVVSRWEGALDDGRLRRLLDNETDADAEEPERVLDVLNPPAAGALGLRQEESSRCPSALP
jgi:aerobic C4-dicarboxylate transport protein